MADLIDWKLPNAESALKLFSNDPLGSASVDHRPVGLDPEWNLSFAGDAAGKLTLNIRGSLTVAALNDATDPDEDGILCADATETPAGALPPQLLFNPNRAYLKYRVEAGVKAASGIPVTALLGFEAGAEASAVFADYRIHTRDQRTRDSVMADLRAARFVTKLDDVLAMAEGDALAFRFAGALNVAVTVSLSEICTGQLGTLSQLLGSTAPIAISVKAGATVGLQVRVSDDFLIVFSRAGGEQWRAGVRKVKLNRVAPSLVAGIDVGFAVQVVAGTTLGKGNLIFRDYGKRTYTFINRKTGDAVRVAERPEFSERKGDPEMTRLRRKVADGTATEAEEKEFSRLSGAYVRELLDLPEEEMFSISRVTVEIPERARIFHSVRCSICGETLAESRARVREGRIVCIPCSEPYGRGWGRKEYSLWRRGERKDIFRVSEGSREGVFGPSCLPVNHQVVWTKDRLRHTAVRRRAHAGVLPFSEQEDEGRTA